MRAVAEMKLSNKDIVRGHAGAARVGIAAVGVGSDARRGPVAEVRLREELARQRAPLGRYAFATEIAPM